MNRWLSLVPLLIFILLAIMLWCGLSLDPSKLPSSLINKDLPHFHAQQLLQPSQSIDERDFKQHVTILNVWATWCATCWGEHSVWMALSQQTSAQLIGLDYKDNRDFALQWLQTRGDPFTNIIDDRDGRIGMELGVYGTPETFIIDKQAKIRYKLAGPLTEAIWQQQLRPLISRLERE